ncbi:chemotaxis protein methyltransferase CheR [Anaerobacterium chartisolvens]|uniref:protein-glutamate O-methyltransferase n=2 Tax=Anaerobacterium chartisolvens TaxID=1297424 RepID=A0A369BHA2_9FIRM|nr:chemotaxis protein methyltransferase CheR [Anaerobacterium chartisolvens]
MMDYEGFKDNIYRMTGINLTFYKEKQMKRRIDSLISKNGFSGYEVYIGALKANKALYNEFINYLTINVSEFYRNPEQWSVLEKDILPAIINSTKNIKIWSSACSTGDEPYTLVMVLNKFMPLKDIRILATDIDKGAIEKAMNGVYTQKSVENLPKEYLTKYFVKSGDMFKIKDEVKNCVQFKQHNLLKDEYPQGCDLIVCRNVLIYFTEEAKSGIYHKFNGALKDNGVLFVGSTEQIILSNKYCLKPIRTFFYIKEASL